MLFRVLVGIRALPFVNVLDQSLKPQKVLSWTMRSPLTWSRAGILVLPGGFRQGTFLIVLMRVSMSLFSILPSPCSPASLGVEG